MSKIQRKSTFRHEGKQEIGENQLSLTGKIKNWQKSAFRRGGKSKIGENRLSQHWENKKLAKNGFPNIGKNKKCHWLHFPTLGKTKNPESQIKDFRGSVHFDTSSFKFSNAY